jgi:hypothetical protein
MAKRKWRRGVAVPVGLAPAPRLSRLRARRGSTGAALAQAVLVTLEARSVETQAGGRVHIVITLDQARRLERLAQRLLLAAGKAARSAYT